ncbi:MAG: ABC transporter substrate-binding protein [Deltaproteobacteria bacterium]|nr:ABC transporter substrate-binding protein [Deltaproteobacteria bacterium]
MKMRSGFGSFFCLFAVSLFFPTLAQPQEKPIRLRVAWTALDIVQAPIWMAHEGGLYRKYGLDVELPFIGATSTALQALAAGEVHLTAAAAETVMRGNLRGAPFVMIVGALKKFPFSFMTQPDITDRRQLQGKRIGVTRFGSLTHTAIQYQLRQWGIKEVSIIQAGGVLEALAAMKAKQLDGMLFPSPVNTMAKRAGFYDLFNFMKEGPDFLTLSVATTKPFLAQNEEAVRRFVKAYAEATFLAKNDKERTLRAAPKYTRVTDREALEDAYEQKIPYLPSVPNITDGEIRQILSVLAETEASARQANPTPMYDTRYVRELDESGFIRSLGRKIKTGM